MTLRWHVPAGHEVDLELLWGWVLLASGAAALALLASGHLMDGWILCPLKVATGVPCPTCGTTRAFLALTRGELGLALRLHPLAPVLAAGAVVYVPYALIVSTAGLPRLRVSPTAREARALRRIVVLAVALVWVFLVLDGR